jgi:hypothetical protein
MVGVRAAVKRLRAQAGLGSRGTAILHTGEGYTPLVEETPDTKHSLNTKCPAANLNRVRIGCPHYDEPNAAIGDTAIAHLYLNLFTLEGGLHEGTA